MNTMDTLVPISRDAMRQLKAQKDEEKRLETNRQIIACIYKLARNVAENTRTTSFTVNTTMDRNKIQMDRMHGRAPATTRFLIELTDSLNICYTTLCIPDILGGLRNLFPGCSVLSTSLSRGQDGTMYDNSTLDVSTLAFIDRRYDVSCITVDWS